MCGIGTPGELGCKLSCEDLKIPCSNCELVLNISRQTNFEKGALVATSQLAVNYARFLRFRCSVTVLVCFDSVTRDTAMAWFASPPSG